MTPLISVIIPVYNVEQYLRRCLDSVVAQTYQNLEIICVDDGSVDHSGKICDQYAARDARIKVIHQENQGLSAARNRGLDAAEGEYIAFVDSDDYILEDMYKKMLDKLLDYNVDLCVCQWQYEFSDGRQVVKKQNIDPAIYGCKTSLEFAASCTKAAMKAVWLSPHGTSSTAGRSLTQFALKGESTRMKPFAEELWQRTSRCMLWKNNSMYMRRTGIL